MSGLVRKIQKRILKDRYGLTLGTYANGKSSWYDRNGNCWGPRLPNVVSKEQRERYFAGGSDG